MLKTVSSITNAIGALNYKGTWNASTNSPALASGVGTKGDYYVVSVAGSTNLDGETLWGVGDWAVYNGAAWQKLEGGSTINATTVTANSYNKMAITAPATSSTLAVADGKTLTASNTLTLAGTDSTTMTFPTTSATIARTDAAQTFTGTQTFGAAQLTNIGISATPSTIKCFISGLGQGGYGLYIDNAAASIGLYCNNSNNQWSTAYNGGASTADGNLTVGKDGTSGRSISAGGTIGASGADYAEYMTKAFDFNLAKGDIVGIDVNGLLTNVFADAIAFVVKSTDPSYVGNDKWWQEAGERPDHDSPEYDAWKVKFELARSKVDRIAFAGQVPVNVLSATAGQYIIPVNDKGLIKGQAVASPTFEQYQIAVGKVISVLNDIPTIIVKVV